MILAQALLRGRPLLADGAIGTSLFAAGLPLGAAPEAWVLDRPDEVEALHRRYVAAGSDILLTNSFGANRRRLAAAGLEPHLRRINQAAARLARRATEGAGRPIVVAGSVGPTGERPGTPAWPSPDALTAIFTEQVEGLAAGGIDVAWFETLSSLDELRAAARAAARTGLPFVVTASFSRGGRTLAGLTPAEVAAALATGTAVPLAIGANCGEGPADILQPLAAMAARTGLPLVAKPSAGLPAAVAGRLVHPVSPAAMAGFAREAAAAGAAIVGGCCGTAPDHIAAMRRALDDAPLS